MPWGKLLREQFRRLARNTWSAEEPGGPEALEFHRRLRSRGVPVEALQAVYDVSPLKAVGYGSAQARLLAYNEFMQMLPMLDETGRANVIRDRIAVRVGYDQVDRYAPAPNVPARLPVDAKIAELENDSMQGGRGVTVQPGENHAVHLQVHSADAVQFLLALEQNAVAPAEAFKYLSLTGPHIGAHLQQIAGDRTRQAMAGQYKDILNKVNQATQRLGEQLAREQRQQQEAMVRAQQQQIQQAMQMQIEDVKAKAQAEYAVKLAKVQADAQIDKAASDAKIAIKSEEARQRMALRDAQTAQKLRAQAEKKRVAG